MITDEQFRHQQIHHDFAIRDVKADAKRLKDEVALSLENAMAAQSKGKADVVAYLLDDALRTLTK